MASTPDHFNCSHCGKRYPWKPALAGTRARCACGQTVTVPEGVQDDDDEGEYALSEPDIPVKAALPVTARPTLSVHAAPAAVAPAGAASVLTYGTRPPPAERQKEFDDLYDKRRDFYWPGAVLVIGFLALLAWAITLGAGGGGLVLFSAYITVATVIKTAVLIGAAFIIAPLAGVSFGTVGPAVLKLAAIVVVTDAGLFWLQEIMQATGAYPAEGGGGGRRAWMAVGLVNTLLAGAIIAVLLKVFFEMDAEDIRNIAIPLAILNRILNFILFLIVAALISAVASAATPLPAAPAPVADPPAQTGGPAAPAPVSPAAAAKDADIAGRLQKKALVRKARDHNQRSLGKRHHIDLVSKLEQAGAANIYFELGIIEGRLDPRELIVELPSTVEERKSVVTQLREFIVASQLPVDPADVRDEGGRYLVIPLPGTK